MIKLAKRVFLYSVDGVIDRIRHKRGQRLMMHHVLKLGRCPEGQGI